MPPRWIDPLSGDPLTWLLEPDPQLPSARYFALTALLDCPPSSPEAVAARQAIHASGPVLAILNAMHPAGYWVEPGPGYYPKYQGTVWSLISLAMLGADGCEPQLRQAASYVLDHSRSPYGGFSAGADPGGMIQCLQGNLVAALIDLGWQDDPRLQAALDWLARSVIGQGIAPASEPKAQPRYYRSGNSGPGFRCAANNQQPCAWGAVKTMLALARLPASARTPQIQQAIDTGAEFLLGCDPSVADYPTPFATKPSRSWFQPGFPLGYVTDFLQILEVFALLGMRGEPRLERAVNLLISKAGPGGRWKMEYTYNGKTWAEIEVKGAPSKWVTLRALRALKGLLPA